MAVTMADITHLRKMTGAGMMDCKNALTEAENDFDKAVEIIRKKGQAVAAKRSDRDASESFPSALFSSVDESFRHRPENHRRFRRSVLRFCGYGVGYRD